MSTRSRRPPPRCRDDGGHLGALGHKRAGVEVVGKAGPPSMEPQCLNRCLRSTYACRAVTGVSRSWNLAHRALAWDALQGPARCCSTCAGKAGHAYGGQRTGAATVRRTYPPLACGPDAWPGHTRWLNERRQRCTWLAPNVRLLDYSRYTLGSRRHPIDGSEPNLRAPAGNPPIRGHYAARAHLCAI